MNDDLDVWFDFTSDTPGYWDNFWENRNGLGAGNTDPDIESPTLRIFHKILWSRELPNGQTMQLSDDDGGYLQWNGMRFGSDSITASFRYERCRSLIEEVTSSMEDYHSFMEDFIRRTYTIGGAIIFPRHSNSINQIRGNNKRISDRWDLTLECIRRFYEGEESPISWCLAQDEEFFNLFVDFKGYVDFFFLQDCVTSDYSEVRLWLGNEPFEDDSLPHTVDDYLSWIRSNLDFVEKRNHRIGRFLSAHL